MKKNKILGLSALALAGTVALTGCAKGMTEEEALKYAQDQGYVKSDGYVKAEDYNINVEDDVVSSATTTGQGGLNYGDLEWSTDLKKAAIREYLQGHNKNYREMYSVATSYNNKPSIANVEYVIDEETFELFGGSEKNTEKLNVMQQNPYVSLYWTKQLREADATKSYFQSYGVEIEGTVKFYDYANLNAQEKAAFLTKIRNYFKSMGPQYAVYYDVNAEGYMSDEQLMTYLTTTSKTVYYSIVPTKITLTSPYLLFAAYNGTDFTSAMFPNEFLSNDFLMSLLTYVRTQKNDNTLTQMLKMQTNSGLKTQTTLTFGN